jgi:glucoamylase
MANANFNNQREAFGWPGIEPRWTHGGKDGVGTAYSASSRIWFTLWNGILTEVYYPTIDRPQLRDLQYLISDGESFFHEEKRHLSTKIERLSRHALEYRVTNIDPKGRYTIIKEIAADPPCILQDEIDRRPLSYHAFGYILVRAAIEVGGRGITPMWCKSLVAGSDGREGRNLDCSGATIPFSRLSCGYVGRAMVDGPG